MSDIQARALFQKRVQASGNEFVEKIWAEALGGKTFSIPPPPPSSPPRWPSRPASRSIIRIVSCLVRVKNALFVLVFLAVVLRLLPSTFSTFNIGSPPQRRNALSYWDLTTAKSYNLNASFTLQTLCLPASHGILSSLHSLDVELSQSIQQVNQTGHHIGDELSYSVKMATHTGKCSPFSQIEPALSEAYQNAHRVRGSLDASLTIYDKTLS